MNASIYLPDSVAVQYSELMQQCVHPAPDGSNISFKSKKIGKKKYWYLYLSIGARRTEHYLGEESAELLEQMENQKTLWLSTEDDRDNRARLVAMLLAGGATGIPVNEGKVLSVLEQAGVFLAGGVIVGTLAFRNRSFQDVVDSAPRDLCQISSISVTSDNNPGETFHCLPSSL